MHFFRVALIQFSQIFPLHRCSLPERRLLYPMLITRTIETLHGVIVADLFTMDRINLGTDRFFDKYYKSHRI